MAPDGALCGDLVTAEQFATELARRFPQATLTREVSIPVVRAAIALARGEPQHVIDVLRTTGTGGGAGFLPYYMRGQAYLRLNRAADAVTQFRTILDHRGWSMMSALYPLAHAGLARALAMAGDVSASRREYEAFFTVWKNADAELPVLLNARQEYARLIK